METFDYKNLSSCFASFENKVYVNSFHKVFITDQRFIFCLFIALKRFFSPKKEYIRLAFSIQSKNDFMLIRGPLLGCADGINTYTAVRAINHSQTGRTDKGKCRKTREKSTKAVEELQLFKALLSNVCLVWGLMGEMPWLCQKLFTSNTRTINILCSSSQNSEK